MKMIWVSVVSEEPMMSVSTFEPMLAVSTSDETLPLSSASSKRMRVGRRPSLLARPRWKDMTEHP